MLFLTLPQALQGGRDEVGWARQPRSNEKENDREPTPPTQDGLNRDATFSWKSGWSR